MIAPRELLLHALGDLLYAENVLVKALPKMAKESDRREAACELREASR